MKNWKQVFCISGLALTLCGCVHPNQSTALTHPLAKKVSSRLNSHHAYSFSHMETTGITSNVMLNGNEVAVLFTKESDGVAMKKLDAFIEKGLYKGIEVVGFLDSKILWTPKAWNMAESEPYQKFTLLSCSLKKH